MYGKGIIRGLGITFKRFLDTYIDDIKHGKGRYYTSEGVAYRSSSEVSGAFTVQYPEERLPTPEEFRFVPFLVYDEEQVVPEERGKGIKKIRCTSCGICAKVCPPQCIWIVRTVDPETGKPIPTPAEFFVDIDICMNCGMCAEFCPFDAIKMDHDYEIAVYDRFAHNIYNLEQLSKPASYYAKIRPINSAREDMARIDVEAAKAARKVKTSA